MFRDGRRYNKEKHRWHVASHEDAPGPETGSDMTGLTREGIVAKACELRFEDAGFNTAQASPRTDFQTISTNYFQHGINEKIC